MIDSLVEIYRGVQYLYDKDERGNRMYSSALKRYAEFYREFYSKYNINEGMGDYESDHVDKPCLAPDTILVSIIERIKRDSSISSSALERVGFLCEYNEKHQHFIGQSTQRNYIEAHHIIPLKYQAEFKYSLDVQANIAALCVVCHKKLHHGLIEEKLQIINKLYQQRIDRLEDCNLHIEMNELVELYR